jgi:hypothetical protein
MNVEVNYLAVLLAALSSMVVGSLWYMPAAFGNIWMKLTGVTSMGKDKGMSMATTVWMYGSVFLASLVTAYVLAHVTFLSHRFFGNSLLQDALSTGFWLWLGFTAMRMFTHDTFEGRRKKLTLLNAAHELVTVLVMAFIIGLLKP